MSRPPRRRGQRPAQQPTPPPAAPPMPIETAPPEPVPVATLTPTALALLDDDGPEREPATAGELKGQIKDWRRGRATKKLSEAFHDAYVALVGALMVGAMLVNVVLQAQQTVARCTSDSCLSARTLLPWAGFAAAVAVALVLSRLFGPVLASAAEGFWLLDAPVSRAALLRSRLLTALLVALLGGAVLGALVTALTGSGGIEVAAWAVAGGLAAAGAVAFSAAQQGAERYRLAQVFGYLFGVAAVAALAAVVAVAAGWLRLGFGDRVGVELAAVLGGFGLLALVLAGVLAARRLDRIRRTRLLSGGALVSGLSGSFFALDLGLARDILVERRAVEQGHVTPQRGQGVGLQAVTWREWQRLRRHPQPLLPLAGTLVVPYAADALGFSRLTPVVAALALFAALIPLLGGLRVLTRTPGLARSMPFTLAQLKRAAIVVAAVVAALWAVLTAAAYLGFGDGAEPRSVAEASLMAVATASAGLLAAVRWTQAKGIDFGAPMISTQAGAFPPGLMTNLFRGFDVAILVTAPMLLGLSPVWSLVVAAIAALILLNSVDAEALRARQEEQRKELEKQKARAAAAQQKKR